MGQGYLGHFASSSLVSLQYSTLTFSRKKNQDCHFHFTMLSEIFSRQLRFLSSNAIEINQDYFSCFRFEINTCIHRIRREVLSSIFIDYLQN